MLNNILFQVKLFPNESERESSQKRVLVLLEALTLINQFYLEENPDTPLMYKLYDQGKIKYKLPAQFEPTAAPGADKVYNYLQQSGAPRSVINAFNENQKLLNKILNGEVFRDIPSIIENGGTDCDGWCAWRTAEIRFHLGVGAKPYITWRKRPDGGMTYHCILIYPDGSSEDPSLLVGMEKNDGGVALREEERKLGERAGEMLDALRQPPAARIVGELERKRRLTEVVGLILRGTG